MSNRIGCCMPGQYLSTLGELTPLEKIVRSFDAVREAGFDYLECSVESLLSLSEDELEELGRMNDQGRVDVPVCNGFLPGAMSISDGEHVEELQARAKEAMRRMQRVGARLLVFGSGKARNVPEGTSEVTAMRRFREFLSFCAGEAETRGVTVVLEPLNRGETNVLNSLGDAAELVREMRNAHVRCLADSWHFYKEGESLSSIEQNRCTLVHVHVAEPPRRGRPGSAGGDYLRAFLYALRRTGYAGGVTAECGMPDFLTDGPAAAAFLRECL